MLEGPCTSILLHACFEAGMTLDTLMFSSTSHPVGPIRSMNMTSVAMPGHLIHGASLVCTKDHQEGTKLCQILYYSLSVVTAAALRARLQSHSMSETEVDRAPIYEIARMHGSVSCKYNESVLSCIVMSCGLLDICSMFMLIHASHHDKTARGSAFLHQVSNLCPRHCMSICGNFLFRCGVI